MTRIHSIAVACAAGVMGNDFRPTQPRNVREILRN
jgi:hypothetical protein